MYDALQVFFFLYMQQEIQEILRLSISILWGQFFLNLYSKLSPVILRNYKKSNWYYFTYWRSLRSHQTIAVFVDKTLSCLENIYLQVVVQSSSVLPRVSFFNEVAEWKPPALLKRDPWRRSCPVNFGKFLRTPILWNTCERLPL